MAEKKQASAYPFRMADDLRTWIQARAKDNDRSVNAELNRLIRQAKELEKQPTAA